jgi:CRP-like cAMP-binding protein
VTALPAVDARELLAGLSLFDGLTTAEVNALLLLTTRKKLRARQVLCRRGDPGGQLHGVLSGRLRVISEGEDGREAILNLIDPGDVIGEISLLDAQPRSATVEALEPTELLTLHRRDLLPYLHRNPKVTLKLAAVLARRVRSLSEVAQDALLLSISGRLGKKLLSLSRSYGVETPNGVKIDLKLPQHELGELVGATRESVNKTLRAWVDSGAIEVERGYITIVRPAELEQAARVIVS